MSTMDKVCELIMKARKNKLPKEELTPDAVLVKDLGFDSLALTELLVLVEDAFSLEIPLAEAQRRQTIGEIVAYVDGCLKR